MKLYIKQKVFSWSDKFAVKDESERDRWFAQGEVFSLGRKLHVCDAGALNRRLSTASCCLSSPATISKSGGRNMSS